MKKNRINLIPLVLAFGLGTGASSLAVSVVFPGDLGTQYGKECKASGGGENCCSRKCAATYGSGTAAYRTCYQDCVFQLIG